MLTGLGPAGINVGHVGGLVSLRSAFESMCLVFFSANLKVVRLESHSSLETRYVRRFHVASGAVTVMVTQTIRDKAGHGTHCA
jgi:hypothetical protein